jgi:hypothetical protein
MLEITKKTITLLPQEALKVQVVQHMDRESSLVGVHIMHRALAI